jgi:hypothetical protein
VSVFVALFEQLMHSVARPNCAEAYGRCEAIVFHSLLIRSKEAPAPKTPSRK